MSFLGYAVTTVVVGFAALFLVSPILHQLPGMSSNESHRGGVIKPDTKCNGNADKSDACLDSDCDVDKIQGS